MLKSLSLSRYLKLAQRARQVAVYREIEAQGLNLIDVAEILSDELQDGALFEYGPSHEDQGRYASLSFGSRAQVRHELGITTLRMGDNTTVRSEPPLAVLRECMNILACEDDHPGIHFMHGATGFLSYDAARLFESIPNRHIIDSPIPTLLFHFYETTLRFDRTHNILLISLMVEPGVNPKARYEQAQDHINALIEKINRKKSNIQTQAHTPSAFQVNVDIEDEAFMLMVEQAKEHIIKGDAFQIVLSRQFSVPYHTSPLHIYRVLRELCPAPYLFYMPINDAIIIGASPEKLISVRHGEVEINPIAGTRPRVEDSQIDDIEHELLNDEKALAEHHMLVDLSRHDLGALCQPGTVKIKAPLQVKHFPYISHITSVVSGQLRSDKDPLHALASAFPAGTLSGAPKIRAMEIIDELETSARGLYGGVICRLDFHGNLDSCIAIRSAVLKDGVATVRTGAGIVYDSNPQAEAHETRHKARGILHALARSQEVD